TWLREQSYIRTSFCKNLHAKCYLNEELCIVTSLNLYEISQVNNNEMGILIRRGEDAELYRDAYEAAQRIIRTSDEVRLSMERVASSDEPVEDPAGATAAETESETGDGTKLTSSKLARKLGLKTQDMLDKLTAGGMLELRDGKHYLTEAGKQAGGEFRMSQRYGPYFLWPDSFTI